MIAEAVASVAFVNPSVGFSDRRKSKPIGLAYIMAYLRSCGHDAIGYDFGDSEDDPVELARSYGLDRYAVVGFSVYNESFLPAIAMANWIKEHRPDATIVLGGPHATAVHEHIMRTYPCVDVIVRREGEESMLAILEALRGSTGFCDIVGTTARGAGGEIIVNPDRPAVAQLDDLPFPDADFISHSGYPAVTYYDEVQQRMKPALTVCSSRSCPFDCSFCGVLTIGRKYRSREAQRVAEEVRYFRERHGINYEHVYFSDANFFVSASRALGVARALHELDENITFSFGTRVNQILRAKEILPQLKECGLRFIELGIESASPDVLERLAKRVSPEVNVAAVKLLKELRIDISLDFIMLDPASTLHDVQANVDFLRALDFYDYTPHDHLYSALVLYEGTPIRQFYERRFGMTFNPDELPPTYGLFERLEVQRFSDEVGTFRREWQARIDEVLARAELTCLSATTGSPIPRRQLAELQLDTVALRHAPNLFFENLLADARRDFVVLDGEGRDGLLPQLGYDRVRLPALLDRVEQVTARYGVRFEAEPVAVGRFH